MPERLQVTGYLCRLDNGLEVLAQKKRCSYLSFNFLWPSGILMLHSAYRLVGPFCLNTMLGINHSL